VVLVSLKGKLKVLVRTFMPLHSLPLDGSCLDTVGCPTSCRLHGAVWPPPTSVLICHPGTLPPPAFFVELHAEYVPEGCWFAAIASAHVERHSRIASPRFRLAPDLQHSPVSSLSVSLLLVLPSGGPPRRLPGEYLEFCVWSLQPEGIIIQEKALQALCFKRRRPQVTAWSPRSVSSTDFVQEQINDNRSKEKPNTRVHLRTRKS
jgi:hypothetical protein